MRNLIERVKRTVAEWDGVSVAPHRFGGIEFRFETSEIGHIHDSGLLDIPFPRAIRDRLVSEGRAVPHHVMPESGWISFWVRAEEDADAAISLLDLSYKRYLQKRARLSLQN